MSNGYVIWTGLLAGIVAASVQFIISHLERNFKMMNKKENQRRKQLEWLREEIGKLIKDVTEIKVPTITVIDFDTIDNAYHLIIADYERSKPLLYKIKDNVTMSGDFDRLHSRYELLQKERWEHGEETEITKLKKDLIEEMTRSKAILLENLQRKEKDVISKL